MFIPVLLSSMVLFVVIVVARIQTGDREILANAANGVVRTSRKRMIVDRVAVTFVVMALLPAYAWLWDATINGPIERVTWLLVAVPLTAVVVLTVEYTHDLRAAHKAEDAVIVEESRREYTLTS